MQRPAGHPDIPSRRIGVLLINLGTPDAPEPKAVRRYLAEFLSDRRVIEIPPIAWQPILHGIILRTRPKKSAHAYKQVWTEHGSPLAAITRRKAIALQERLGEAAIVRHAMRYGNPSIAAELREMKAEGCERILLAPLYPQYCAATTATANDARLRGAGRHALAAGDPHLAALLRRSRLYRRAEGQSGAAAGGAGFRAGEAAAQLPRHAAAHAGTRRSLSLPLPEDGAPARRAAVRSRSTSPSSRASAAPNGSSRTTEATLADLSRPGRQAHRRRRARILRRLPGDARGARHPRPRDFPCRRRRAFRACSNASTTAARAWTCSTRWSAANLQAGCRGA